MSLNRTAAYQGSGWRPRRGSLREDVASGLWSPFQVNSEWADLKAVALYKPSTELRAIKNPNAVQHLRPVSVPALAREYKTLVQTYRRLGVQVIELEPKRLHVRQQKVPPNLLFVRDLFFNTPAGAVISRMASEVRAGEEKFAAAALAARAVPILATIQGRGTFEGADALWLNARTVLCGVGVRTNREAFAQLKRVLAAQDIECLTVPMPKGVQHLLGILQIVDRDVAIVREQKASRALLKILEQYQFDVYGLKESTEITERQAMNFVCVKPRTVVMARGCPQTRKALAHARIKVAAEVTISQFCNAAGGIACATGIVSRKVVP